MLLFLFMHLEEGQVDWVIPPPQIHIESYFSVNMCSVFYLEACLWYSETFREKFNGSQVSSLFIGNHRQHMSLCAKMISSWVRKIISIAKAHVYRYFPGCCGFGGWYQSYRKMTGPECLL